MSLYAELDTQPTRRDLLAFGLVFAAGMGALGAWLFFGAHARSDRAMVFPVVGAVVLLLSLVPPVGRVLYILWMGLGITIGFVTGPIMMLVLYGLVVVPVGLWFRVTKRDALRRRIDPTATSYWEDYPGSDDPASYIRQF